MSLDWEPRSTRAIRIHAILALAAFALLVARNVPPDFPQAPFPQHTSISSLATVRAISTHDQRPRFDCSQLDRSAPINGFLPFPPTTTSAHFISASQFFSTLRIKGFHYNRPPPAA
jgi:hypothetical protein